MLGEGPTLRNDALVSLLLDARQARAVLLDHPGRTIKEIAAAIGQCRHRLTRLIKLSWLAPAIVDAILTGTQPAGLAARQLYEADLPLDWAAQKALLGFA